MKPLRVTMKVRNNRLTRLREDLGLTQTSFAPLVGMIPNQYNRWENMRETPRRANGEWRAQAVRLAEYHGVSPNWLFSDVVLSVNTNSASREVDAHEVLEIMSPDRLALSAGDALDAAETRDELRSMLAKLTDRERKILEMRFGLNGHAPCTLETVAQTFGISRERARQIEARELRKLRSRFYGLRGWLSEPTGKAKERAREMIASLARLEETVVEEVEQA